MFLVYQVRDVGEYIYLFRISIIIFLDYNFVIFVVFKKVIDMDLYIKVIIQFYVDVGLIVFCLECSVLGCRSYGKLFFVGVKGIVVVICVFFNICIFLGFREGIICIDY